MQQNKKKGESQAKNKAHENKSLLDLKTAQGGTRLKIETFQL
jgi:hypothetical protein